MRASLAALSTSSRLSQSTIAFWAPSVSATSGLVIPPHVRSSERRYDTSPGSSPSSSPSSSSSHVHLGVGQFHRSHVALYSDRVLEADAAFASNSSSSSSSSSSSPDWSICGISLGLGPALEGDRRMTAALKAQDGLYTLVERDGSGSTARVVGAHAGGHMCVADDGAEATVRRLALPATKVVSLTITEKGYCQDPATGRVDLDDPLVRKDLSGEPTTALGLVLHALRDRWRAGERPFTVMSCDNIQGNGHLTQEILCDMAGALAAGEGGPGFETWIREEGAFPNSMVDRITPATTPADVEALRADFFGGSCEDAVPVVAEPFIQWVLEDAFVGGERPPWEEHGALLVEDVLPYEMMKLRLLNGGHSAISCAGLLAGHRAVDEAMADPAIHAYLTQYMEEMTPAVPAVPGVDLDDYKETLRTRFANPSIGDQLGRLAEDGSQKFRGFIAPGIEAAWGFPGAPPMPATCVAVASWIAVLAEGGVEGVELKEPMLAELQPLAAGAVSEAVAGGGGGPASTGTTRELLAEDEPHLRMGGEAMAQNGQKMGW